MGIIARGVDAFCGILLGASFAVIQALIGGTRLVFSLPAYGLMAIAAGLSVISIKQRRPPPAQICLLSATAFIGYVALRGFLSSDDYLARADIYLALSCLLVYLFVANVFTGSKQRVWFLFFLLALGVIQVCIAAIQFRDGTNFMLIPFLQRFDYGRRVSGFYVNPNHFAGLLEVLGVFGLSITCWGRWSVWVKLLVLYAAAVCYVALILTGSRGGYYSSAVGLVCFSALSVIVLSRAGSTIFRRVGGITFAVAGLVAVIVFYFATQSLFVTERARGGLTDEGYNRRPDLWRAAVEQWQLQPMIGTGSGTYLYYGRQFRAELTNKDPVYVHNDYLQLLAEYGVVGGVLFLIFFGAHLYNGWRNFLRLGPKRVSVSTRLFSNALALQIAALAAIATYVVHSIVDFNLHIPANALLLAFVFALLANPGTARKEKTVVTVPLVVWRLAIPVLAVLVLIQCWRLLPAEYFTERARMAVRDNDPGAASAFATHALATEKQNPNIYLHLGRAIVAEGVAAESEQKRAVLLQIALVAFQKGWALAKQDEIFPLELALLYDSFGRFPEGEWMYDEALRLDPRNQDLKRYYASHLDHWRESESSPPPNNR
ncbi:MAG TPA: O-antigen ligase [Chthoniobacterales bacterium]|nr:O-antigen ligase [Chthoniobacterales bacterium]